MYKHACIKCHTQYEDSDPDPYYCPPCNETRKAIAKEVDKKLSSREPKHAAPSFDEQVAQMKTFRGIPIINL